MAEEGALLEQRPQDLTAFQTVPPITGPASPYTVIS